MARLLRRRPWGGGGGGGHGSGAPLYSSVAPSAPPLTSGLVPWR
jgi:hypothetical protein